MFVAPFTQTWGWFCCTPCTPVVAGRAVLVSSAGLFGAPLSIRRAGQRRNAPGRIAAESARNHQRVVRPRSDSVWISREEYLLKSACAGEDTLAISLYGRSSRIRKREASGFIPLIWH